MEIIFVKNVKSDIHPAILKLWKRNRIKLTQFQHEGRIEDVKDYQPR
ncbi:hypothetical protein HMP0721_1693 [Pseudoramibacter alactolyticus ATCC 23263]|uniref:Uncharacterized protein n=1 Tax=Pseudoramibacter alactolyticus ATCC 23263 TaxID=887929 RepID=E6MHY8_9FIRM|nr:hypothetical protein HMP0721_1693 [Pseudoramibacter alactolyticus ATCC 23263]